MIGRNDIKLKLLPNHGKTFGRKIKARNAELNPAGTPVAALLLIYITFLLSYYVTI